MKALYEMLGSFCKAVAAGQIEIYNEFSLQHELGLFLRERLPSCKVQFERNVSFFFPEGRAFTKREIDIAIFSPDQKVLAYAIELKYPRNGQYPEQMFSFCKDIAFLEELREAGFHSAALVIFAEDRPFYAGKPDGIYGYFRGGKPLRGRIEKPTGAKDDAVDLKGSYTVEWRPVANPLRCAIIPVGHEPMSAMQ